MDKVSNNDYNEETNLLYEMRKSRELAVVAYKRFTEDNQYHNDYLFCFYEGEDGKYYDPRLRKYFVDFKTYKAGDKSEVLKAFKIIKNKPEYSNVNVMFFIDRDFDEPIAGKYDDLYETPCYSIENFYVNEICFSHILQSEFYLNTTDDDYIKCINDFKKCYDKFHKIIVKFNAMLLLRNKKSISNSKYKFGNMSTSRCIDISIQDVKTNPKFEETLLNIKHTLDFTDDEIEKAITELITKGNYENNFRGKNEFDFFICIINSLKHSNKNNTYFTNKIENVKINITCNRLSELSQYAVTPNCLDTFLKNHLKAN